MVDFKFEVKDNNISKYLQLYNYIKEQIITGELKKEEKLPPIRKLAKALGINNATVVKAYELLEKEAYISKHQGSGTYVSYEPLTKVAEPVEIDGEVLRFDTGNPSTDLFPIEDFKKAINMSLERLGGAIFEYGDGLGSVELRAVMVDYLASIGIRSSMDKIQIISGAQQGIDIVAKTLIDYSDPVFIEEPTYNGAIQLFKGRGARLISIPMLAEGLDIGVLKMKLEKIRPKLVYAMANFQNPTGISYSEKIKKKLIDLAEEYDFYILEDDFISDFKFDSDNNKTLKYYDKYDRVIYIKSFSKILMPGLRVGLMCVPEDLKNKIFMAKYASDISTSGLIQGSLYYYMKYFNWSDHMQNMEKKLSKKFFQSCCYIRENMDKRLRLIEPSGGMNLMIELKRGYDSQDFAEFILDKGVYITPGRVFFDNDYGSRFFRLNIGRESFQALQHAIHIINTNLDDFENRYKGRVNNKNINVFI